MSVAAQVDSQREEYGAGAEAWVPKVGERVRTTWREYKDTQHDGVVRSVNSHSVLVEYADGWNDGHDGSLGDGVYTRWWHAPEDVTPLPVASEEQPADAGGVFKVGDRVRRVTPSDWPEDYGKMGREYTVLSVGLGGNPVVIEGKPAADRDAFVLVGAPLRIEAGKFYRTRDGRKVLVNHNQYYDPAEEGGFPWCHDCGMDSYHGVDAKGKSCTDCDDDDLVAEWVDEPQASNDNAPSTTGFTIPLFDEGEARATDLNLTIALDAGNLHEELDEIIAKLKKIRKLQRQTGLAA